MSWQTITLIVVISALAILAVIKYFLDKKKGKKCGGGCSGCNIANCPSRLNSVKEHSTDNNAEVDDKR